MSVSIPIGVRNITYSFLPILELLDTISFLSTKDRQSLLQFNCDQPKNLTIVMSAIYPIKLKNIKYAVKMASSIQLLLSK